MAGGAAKYAHHPHRWTPPQAEIFGNADEVPQIPPPPFTLGCIAKTSEACVHRKGATRSFGPGREELNPIFRKTGQPVLVPGDMARASYLLVGKGNPLTWSSSCHGAGRELSRIQSRKKCTGDPIEQMKSQGVHVMATSRRTITEEMPHAYKNVDAVVEAVKEAELADPVARLKPALVIKG